jgi:xanthine dioxygenase
MSSSDLTFQLLPDDIRQSSLIGAQVNLPVDMNILDLEALSENNKDVLRQALFENQVVVIRGQKGIDPKVLPQLTKIFDPTATDIHSAGEKSVSDPKNILSAYKAGRIPRAPQVSVIGSGNFQNYEGIDYLEVVHLVRHAKLCFLKGAMLTRVAGSHFVSRPTTLIARITGRIHSSIQMAHGHPIL